MRALVSLRSSSSVFPENMDPQTISIQPVRSELLLSFSRNIPDY
jgi:hypothetical protein